MAGLAGKATALAAELATQAKPALKTFIYYAKVELVPPKPNELLAVGDGVRKLITGFATQSWRKLPIKEAWLNTLIAVEVGCWFYVGECIGKRHIIGYDV